MTACETGSAAQLITRYYLGFDCTRAAPIMTLRNPADLANWTLPVLEWTIVLGAVLALIHAIRRLRDGDPVNLALWIGAVVFLFVTEPPLYFPQWFGLQGPIGFMFAHNVFSVQFMYDRLPLYIVAFYPAVSQIAYEIVRTMGIVARRGPLAGAVCVAFVYQVFYEIFDQLGPQLKWWAWNIDASFYGPHTGVDDLGNPQNQPMLASVPMNSIWVFASASFGVLTYLVVRLIGTPTAAGRRPRGRSLVWRIVVAGALTPLGMAVFAIPTGIASHVTAGYHVQTVILTVEIAALWIAGLWIILSQWRSDRVSQTSESPDTQLHSAGEFLAVFGVLYLVVFAVLWISALPAYFGAVDGVTSNHTPIGSLPYTVACFVVAAAVLGRALYLSRVTRYEACEHAAGKAIYPGTRKRPGPGSSPPRPDVSTAMAPTRSVSPTSPPNSE